MKKATAITCMFLDIGGVLLTNGWDHHARKQAANNFKLEWAELEDAVLMSASTVIVAINARLLQLKKWPSC